MGRRTGKPWGLGCGGVLCSALVLAGAPAVARGGEPGYPTKAIELVVPFPAGGPVDVLGRVLAQAAPPHAGQAMVVVNKPGGGGTIGTAAVARARPDGYTVLVAAIPPTVIAPHLVKVPYTPSDFIPVAQLSARTVILAVRAEVPFKTLGDLLEHARGNPERLTYTTTRGTLPHLLGADLFRRGGVRLVLLPQAGDAPAIAATLGGNADAVLGSRVSLLPHIRAGALRPLVVFNERRDPALPDVPTAKERGFDVAGNPWTGIALAKGTPEPIVRWWEELLRKMVEDPGFLDAMKKVNEDIVYLDRARFTRRWFDEPEIYGRIIQEIGLTAQ